MSDEKIDSTNELEVEEKIMESVEEKGELTDEEKREIYIQHLKDSRKVFNPIKHIGNKTINPYGVAYKKKRQNKNKMAKNSRRMNQKK